MTDEKKSQELAPEQLITRLKLLNVGNDVIVTVEKLYGHIKYYRFVLDCCNKLIIKIMSSTKITKIITSDKDLENNPYDLDYNLTKDQCEVELFKKDNMNNVIDFKSEVQNRNLLIQNGYKK